ncbi:MAG: 3-ketoacyl-ACP reductase [Acidobacteriales bacterium 59-55]|nr:3-ketoacyl-ACP reductase [Terriglobales bacterium]OJV43125.1 MAG: 3-ketoacyl-ACP reductase [Acidobacteriales bacterium 59-55]
MSNARVALVTGGTRGIGLGIAKKLASKGFSLMITGRRSHDEAAAAIAQLREEFGDGSLKIQYCQADVADASHRERLLEDVEAIFGRLDILVNNAGIAPSIRADILDASEESFDELISTNLKGPYFLTQAAANWMIRLQEQSKEHRCIINIGSVSATVASVNRGDYCITKAGIAMATILWAARLTQYGIGVYEVRPGLIETDMTKGVRGKYDSLIKGDLLLEKRWGTPEDIGIAVTMLASGDLPYSPGAVLTIDGGLTVSRF